MTSESEFNFFYINTACIAPRLHFQLDIHSACYTKLELDKNIKKFMIYRILKNFMGRNFFGPFLQNYAIFAHQNTSRLRNISFILKKPFLTCRYGYKLHFKTNLRNFYQFFGILERKMCAKGRKRAKNKEFV